MRATIPVLLTLLAPAALGAQQSASVSTTTAAGAATPAVSATASADAAADVRIERALARAEAEGVSTESLSSRARMGAARGVAPTRIAAALEQRLDALIASRDALRAHAVAHTEGTIELGADAIESGARASHVAQVAAGFRAEERMRALAVLGSLAANGEIGADAIASVRSALDAGYAAATGADAGPAAATSATSSATAYITGNAHVAGGTLRGATSSAATVSGAINGALPR